ncbi:hypothetical protein J437_LFUL013001 [Ladona fulva]|uniref:Uncharacterized protein n=1 Tax=Ladona fulva TaxID=123851 RepID=A0A8K0KCU7_LADFU|nr:hypothetical protein J437_LFUL013001 [Ladona fulva]
MPMDCLVKERNTLNRNQMNCIPAMPKSNSYLGKLWDLQKYNNHRKNVLQAKSKVDNFPPKIGFPQLYKTKKLSDQAQRMARIQKENKKLLQSINVINRTKV